MVTVVFVFFAPATTLTFVAAEAEVVDDAAAMEGCENTAVLLPPPPADSSTIVTLGVVGGYCTVAERVPPSRRQRPRRQAPALVTSGHQRRCRPWGDQETRQNHVHTTRTKKRTYTCSTKCSKQRSRENGQSCFENPPAVGVLLPLAILGTTVCVVPTRMISHNSNNG